MSARERIAATLLEIERLDREHAERMAHFQAMRPMQDALHALCLELQKLGITLNAVGCPTDKDALHIITPTGPVTLHVAEIPEPLAEAIRGPKWMRKA